jgi:hypothetical protein
MFVGYSPNHGEDTYRTWDPETKQAHLSRDILWLNKFFSMTIQRGTQLEMKTVTNLRRSRGNI